MAKNKKEKNNKTNSNTNSSAKNTTKSTTKTNPPAGVSQESWNTANSEFKGSKELDSQRDTRENYASKAENFYSNTNIVDDNTKSKMNASLNDYLSPEIEQTNTYLDSQLGKIQSGKTSWSEQYGNAINDFLNREKFEYDVDDDQLFQQALASAMNSGKTAMQDTIGQASALTGGYGSTYATSAGNQAYNQFIEDAYNNLPEYYKMAMEAYQAEGNELLNRVNVLSTADNTEYTRTLQGFNSTLDYSNTLWDRDYKEWSTDTSNAINFGNFLLNENTTIGNNLKNAYDISSNEYELLYGEEYNTWKTGVENAWKAVSTEQTGYWNEKDNTYKYDSLAQEKEISDKEIEYKYAALEQDDDQFDKEFNAKYTPDGNGGYVAKGTTSNGFGDFTAEEMEVASKSENVELFNSSIMTNTELLRRGKKATIGGKQKTFDTYNQYIYSVLDDWLKKGKVSKNEAAFLKWSYNLTDDDAI